MAGIRLPGFHWFTHVMGLATTMLTVRLLYQLMHVTFRRHMINLDGIALSQHGTAEGYTPIGMTRRP